MSYKTLLVEQQDQIVTITINRPKALNAINREVMAELNDFFIKNHSDYSIRGVVITGAGEKAFVAGADIKEFASLSASEASNMSSFGHQTYDLIEQFHAPVIAAINGFALGGGCELAMACHMRIAAANARLGQPEANLGLSPGYGGTQRLTLLVGKAKAFELLFTARLISAEEALNLNLVNEIVEEGKSLNRSIEILNTIKSKAPLAIMENIKMVNAAYGSKGYKMEADGFGRLMVTDDAKEGALAFVEKRQASFTAK